MNRTFIINLRHTNIETLKFMKMRYAHMICLLLVSVYAHAQTDRVGILLDTIPNDRAVVIVDGQTPPLKINDSISTLRNYRFEYKPLTLFNGTPTFNNYPSLSMPFYSFIPGEATVYGWNSGRIVAHGFSSVYPGLMKIDSGSIGISQNLGNFSFYIGGMANKYGFFRGLHTQYGINGSISYSFNERLSATVFGTYYFGRPPSMPNGMSMPPAMIGFYNTSRFGGYVDYEISDHFGMEAGAQAVQRVGTSKYEPEPIVTPYMKIGSGKSKVKIGLPVGQIMYHILKK